MENTAGLKKIIQDSNHRKQETRKDAETLSLQFNPLERRYMKNSLGPLKLNVSHNMPS
jgi:hypothetical protein